MCIIGGGNGWAFFFVAIPMLMLLRWLSWQSRRSEREFRDPNYPHLPPLQDRPAMGNTFQDWTCLNPRCRHHNPAGANYCARCGATRGYAFHVDEDDSD